MSTEPTGAGSLLRDEAAYLRDKADAAESKIAHWRLHAEACEQKADTLDALQEHKAGVRVRPSGIELVVGPTQDDWQFRAVIVGKGVEITHNERFHGWITPEITQIWARALLDLSRKGRFDAQR